MLGVTAEVALAPVAPLVAPAEPAVTLPPVVALDVSFVPVVELVALPVVLGVALMVALPPVVLDVPPPVAVLFVVLDTIAPPGITVADPPPTVAPAAPLLVAFAPVEPDVLGALAVMLPPVVAPDVAFVLGAVPLVTLPPVVVPDVALALGVALMVALPVVVALPAVVAFPVVLVPVTVKLAAAAFPNESDASMLTLCPETGGIVTVAEIAPDAVAVVFAGCAAWPLTKRSTSRFASKPLPLTFTEVPTGPDVGDIVTVSAAWPVMLLAVALLACAAPPVAALVADPLSEKVTSILTVKVLSSPILWSTDRPCTVMPVPSNATFAVAPLAGSRFTLVKKWPFPVCMLLKALCVAAL